MIKIKTKMNGLSIEQRSQSKPKSPPLPLPQQEKEEDIKIIGKLDKLYKIEINKLNVLFTRLEILNTIKSKMEDESMTTIESLECSVRVSVFNCLYENVSVFYN